MCIGCQKPFCREHHQEHRRSIENDFNGLIQQHNILKQNLYNENDDNNSRTSQLLKTIDNWEKEMITKIKAAAAANKARIAQIVNEEKDQLKNKFKLMAEELKTNQSSNDYVESDIQEWQRQISECKQKLEQLQAGNNGFINIDVKSIDWSSSINIQQRKDIAIKKNVPVAAKLIIPTRRERPVNCVYCDKSFYVSAGYNSRFCSESCETNYDSHNPERSSSDDGGAVCFHGNCIVSLANGLTKLAKDIRRGDVLKTADGLNATVTYVIKISRKNKNTPMVRFDSGLLITPWHPVRIDGHWVFPHDVGHKVVLECDEVYNFALDVGHIIIINGIECVTLGHDFKGDVIEHPYYGTSKVLDDLRAIDIFNDGFIELLPNSTVRSKETGLVSGICRYAATASTAQSCSLSIIPYNEHI